MDTKSKALFYVFFLIVIVSVVLTYYRTIVVRDYYVTGQATSEADK